MPKATLFTIAKNVETIQMSTGGWMDKQMGYMQTMTHSALQRKLTGYNADDSWGHDAKPDTKGHTLKWFHSDKVCRIVKFTDTESRMGVARGWAGDKEFQFGKMNASGDRWWRWYHNSENVFNATEWYTWKWLRWECPSWLSGNEFN